MPASSTHEIYTRIVHETEVDGGWSGRLRVVVGNNGLGAQDLVFVDSDLLGPRRLVLTTAEAAAVGEALSVASATLK